MKKDDGARAAAPELTSDANSLLVEGSTPEFSTEPVETANSEERVKNHETQSTTSLTSRSQNAEGSIESFGGTERVDDSGDTPSSASLDVAPPSEPNSKATESFEESTREPSVRALSNEEKEELKIRSGLSTQQESSVLALSNEEKEASVFTVLAETGAEDGSISTSMESVEEEPPILTRRQIRTLASIAAVLCVLLLIPAVMADYLCSRLIVAEEHQSGKKKKKRFHKHKLSTARRVLPILFEGEEKNLVRGWLFRAWKSNQRLVMYLHQFNGHATENRPLLEALLLGGFDVFTFDAQGHGKSGGKVGLHPRRQANDLRTAYRYLKKVYPTRWRRETAVVGVGTGASAAMLFAKRERNVRAVIAAEPVMNLQKELEDQLKGYPSFVVSLTTQRIARVASIRYRDLDFLNNRRSFRNVPMQFWGKKSSNMSEIRSFCKKLRRPCKPNMYIRRVQHSWWMSLSNSQRKEVIRFVREKTGVHEKSKNAEKRPKPRPNRLIQRLLPRKPKPRARLAKQQPAGRRKPKKSAASGTTKVLKPTKVLKQRVVPLPRKPANSQKPVRVLGKPRFVPVPTPKKPKNVDKVPPAKKAPEARRKRPSALRKRPLFPKPLERIQKQIPLQKQLELRKPTMLQAKPPVDAIDVEPPPALQKVKVKKSAPARRAVMAPKHAEKVAPTRRATTLRAATGPKPQARTPKKSLHKLLGIPEHRALPGLPTSRPQSTKKLPKR